MMQSETMEYVTAQVGSALPGPPPRGVHHLPWHDSSGNRLLIAIDSTGRKVHELAFATPDSFESARRALWNVLDAADPKGGA